MLELAVFLGLTAALVTSRVFASAPRYLRTPLVMFNGFYFLTSVIGAVLIASPDFRLFWSLGYTNAASSWLNPGSTGDYWVLVLGPFILVNLVAARTSRYFRLPAIAVARNLSWRPSLLSVALVGAAFVTYCTFNLGVHGYLGVSLLSAENVGLYRENIQLRTEMANTLGETHFGLIYMAIPALCCTALLRAFETRRFSWWLLLAALSLALVLLYMSTLTKSFVLVFFISLAVAASFVGAFRMRGVVIAGLSGVLALTALQALLTGSGPLEVVGTIANIILRLSSAIPFYAEVFPEQHPYVGIDYGLQFFGIGPDAPANFIVYNYMSPKTTWVQGAAPAAAHIAAYAQAGIWWSLFTMLLVGFVIGFVARLGSVARSALSRSLFVGGAMTCYYMTQTDFFGAFNHAYGFKWWLLGVLILVACELALRWLAVVPDPRAASIPDTLDAPQI